MKLIAFTKHFKKFSPVQLIDIAHEAQLDGWDLCVRPGYPVNPDNAAIELPAVERQMAAQGLAIPMVTGNFDLKFPDHPTARPILSAMDKADIRFLKLGYYGFDPVKQDYWKEVEMVRFAFDGWQQLARQYNVKVCYHTHSERCMGLTCGAIMHLLRGFDPRYIGAYIDPAHLVVEGEEFPVGLAMVRDYLSLVAVKDVIITREEKNGHGKAKLAWLGAPAGMVDWTAVFEELVRVGYDGPISVHCEFVQETDPQFMEKVSKEVAFFRKETAKYWPLKKG